MEEEFVFRCLLSGDTVLQAPTIPEKDDVFGGRYWGGALDSNETAGISVPGKEVFESVDAMIRIYDFIQLQHRQKDELLMLFRYQKFPESVMRCVDELLRQGMDYRFIEGVIKRGGYQRLLETDGKVTEAELKRRVGICETFAMVLPAQIARLVSLRKCFPFCATWIWSGCGKHARLCVF